MKVKWTELSVLEQEELVKNYTNSLVVNAYLICYKKIDKALEKIKKDCPEYLHINLIEENKDTNCEYRYTEDQTIPVIIKLCDEGRYFTKQYQNLEEFCAGQTRMTYVPEKFVTEELMCINAKNYNPALAYMDKSKVTANVIMAASECKYSSVTTYLHPYIDLLDDEQLTHLLLNNKGVVNEIPEKRWTKKMLYAYLEHLVKNNIVPDIDYMCKIPEKLKDVVYWRSLCMLHGYYYSQIPEDMKKTVIIPKLIQATIDRWDKGTSRLAGNGLHWMLQSLPAEFVTEDVEVEVCIRNPTAIRHVKEKEGKITEAFLDRLSGYGNLNFLDWLNEKELPEKYKKKRVERIIESQFMEADLFCSKKHSKEEWTAYIKTHGASIDRIPKEFMSEEMCLYAMRSNGFAALAKIPDKYKTEHFWKTVVKERTYYKPVRVPEEYLTKEEVIAFCKEKNIHDDKDLPEKFRAEDVLLEITTLPDNFFISKKNQTQAIADKAVENGKTLNLKVFILSKISRKFWRKDVVNELCCTCRDAILLKEGLTEEQINISIQAFPENILKAPLWYREKVRTGEIQSETIKKDNNINTQDVKSSKAIEIESFSQISIWDILNS